MKRRYYQIEGDILTSDFRLLLERKDCTLQAKSYFSWLPLDLVSHILSHLYKEAQYFQYFLQFLFLEFGLPLKRHKSAYSQSESELLTLLTRHLSEGYPSLFQECREAHLQRICYCIDSKDIYYRGSSIDARYAALDALYRAKYAALYSFINQALCECCQNHLSELTEVVALCKTCLKYGSNIKLFDQKSIDYVFLAENPECAYYWLTEKKLRQFCRITRSQSLDSFFQSRSIRTTNIYLNRKNGTQKCYLLKDSLPFIHSKFKLNQ